MSECDQAGFLIFALVFVSRDFELGRNASCEESTVVPYGANLFKFCPSDNFEISGAIQFKFMC